MEVSSAFGPVSGTLRLLRAVMIGMVMMFTGVLGHVSAGGLLPSAWVLTSLLAINILAATLFTGRPLRIRYIVLLVAAGQTAVHLGLSLSAGHVGEAPLAVAQVINGDVVVSVAWQQLLAELSAHAPMMLAHLMGGFAVGMWLGVGERALWALIADGHTRLIRPLIALRIALAGLRTPVVVGVPQLPEVPSVRPRVAILARSVVRRGPPVLLAA